VPIKPAPPVTRRFFTGQVPLAWVFSQTVFIFFFDLIDWAAKFALMSHKGEHGTRGLTPLSICF